MKVTQRSTMRKLFEQLGGDQELVIQAYAAAEVSGEVSRSRNDYSMPAIEYARRLWYDGVKTGWLTASSIETVYPSKQAVEPKAPLASNSIPLFDDCLRRMARFWKEAKERPQLSEDTIDHWSTLVRDLASDPSMPLLVRKGAQRTIKRVHPCGRVYASCDNSPAQWAFMGAYRDARPSLDDVRQQFETGRLPLAYARTREEARAIGQGEAQPLGGLLGGSAYGQINRFPDGKTYKLCHIKGVRLGTRGDIDDFEPRLLQVHLIRLLDPSNMFVVPLEYAGIGECRAFIDAFVDGDNRFQDLETPN